MKTDFDLLCDIFLHIGEVQEQLEVFASELKKRGLAHDRTKLQEFEFDAFVSTREKFKKANYGTPEYQECVVAIQPAIDHHYAANRHHTAFHKNGINDMTLVDIVEMVCDWKAANRRSPDKSFSDTLEYCFKKYGVEPQLQRIMLNTFAALGWIKEGSKE